MNGGTLALTTYAMAWQCRETGAERAACSRRRDTPRCERRQVLFQRAEATRAVTISL